MNSCFLNQSIISIKVRRWEVSPIPSDFSSPNAAARYRRRRCCFSRPSFPFFVVSRSSQFSTNTVVSAEKALARVSEKKMLQITSSSLSSSTPIPTLLIMSYSSSNAISISSYSDIQYPLPFRLREGTIAFAMLQPMAATIR